MPEGHNMSDNREVRIRLSNEEWAQLQDICEQGQHPSCAALARSMFKEMLRDDRLAQQGRGNA